MRSYTNGEFNKAVLKAVEANRGIAPVTPEAYFFDIFHRLSRSALGFFNRCGLRLFWKGL